VRKPILPDRTQIDRRHRQGTATVGSAGAAWAARRRRLAWSPPAPPPHRTARAVLPQGFRAQPVRQTPRPEPSLLLFGKKQASRSTLTRRSVRTICTSRWWRGADARFRPGEAVVWTLFAETSEPRPQQASSALRRRLLPRRRRRLLLCGHRAGGGGTGEEAQSHARTRRTPLRSQSLSRSEGRQRVASSWRAD
jgi:hypothetical protein